MREQARAKLRGMLQRNLLPECWSRTAVYHWRATRTYNYSNFGDDVNVNLWAAITNTSVEQIVRPVPLDGRRRRVLLIGSVLTPDRVRCGDVILGAGARSSHTFCGLCNCTLLAAVRGLLTLRTLQCKNCPIIDKQQGAHCQLQRWTTKSDGSAATISLGDPALYISLLVPDFFSVRASGGGGVCALPHASDGVLLAWANAHHVRGQVRVIRHYWHPLQVMNAISSCDLVVSSSLHGLIFSDALGIPSVFPMWRASTFNEPRFKYVDYLSGLDGGDGFDFPRDMFLDAEALTRQMEKTEHSATFMYDIYNVFRDCALGSLNPRISFASRVSMATRFVDALVRVWKPPGIGATQSGAECDCGAARSQ